MVRIGIDRIGTIRNHIDGKRLGILTNNSARNSNLESTLDIILKMNAARSVTVFTPEHGYYGENQAGEPVRSYEQGKIKFISLYYGDYLADGKDLDENMRNLDTETRQEIIAKPEGIDDIDTFIIDLPDVGSRVYTYASTMFHLITILQRHSAEIFVLDRPNPVTGKYVEGTLLKKEYSSFIGMLEVPLRHGLTIGELALIFTSMKIKREVNVVKLDGWKRSMWYDDSGLRWVMPSPNIPTLETALVYLGNVIFEGTNVSEGRGTTRPFLTVGAPWMNSGNVASRMNSISSGEYRLVDVKFRPTFSKYSNELCRGVEVHVLDREKFRPIRFAINLLSVIHEYDEFEFHGQYFDRVMGDPELRRRIESGDLEWVFNRMDDEEEKFLEIRKDFLLYPE